ncbi:MULTISPECIES: hypothetical protein [Paenibacillus]|uniref:hypothetical protein n=1 Tax=Paenibacillus TaxID=44249 RepID=UPI0009A8A916|nr:MULTISPECIES: hypothetical protein [Paenibacillus]MCZ1268242.1 hypothetical protein [Paenibacillus tundrae]SLK16239.1 hypothetical protein SAMN06272722_110111 [Paenibacillus sp. RU5A]SOC74278.1 hypothetical protein SAMN05880581_110111 [Paenibacillus sp. RU26A]SOC76428.1 hypothetical protein SAMN05880586_110111 [Paenibacillus sp. RU5M]
MEINEKLINIGSPKQFVIGLGVGGCRLAADFRGEPTHFLSTSKSELLEHVVSVPSETEIAAVIKHFVSRNATV